MEEFSKPYGVVTDDCVELVGKDAVSVDNQKKGLRFKPDLLPTVHPDRGLTLTFWLKLEWISANCNGIDVVFQCGSGSYRTPTMWFRGHSTQAHVYLSHSAGSQGSESSGGVLAAWCLCSQRKRACILCRWFKGHFMPDRNKSFIPRWYSTILSW